MYPGTIADRTPNKPAVVMAENGSSLSYDQLDRQSVQLARYFAAQGLRRGDTVALLSPNDPLCFIVYWAAVRSGLYICPLNHHLTPVELSSVVAHAEPRALVVHHELTHLADSVRTAIPSGCHVVVQGSTDPFDEPLGQLLAGIPDHRPADQPRGGEMLYSSGTTGGSPKGIRTPPVNRQVDAPGDALLTTFAPRYEFDDRTVYLSPAPLYHGGPLRFAVMVQSVGGTVVVLKRFDAELALAAIQEWECTHSQWVPTMFVRMLKLPEHVRAGYDVSSMRRAVHASAPCPIDVKRAMIQWWGPIIDEYYASQESAGVTMISSKEWLERPGSVGLPVLGEIRICDGTGRVLGPGEIGTIYFARDIEPFSYFRAPDLTRAAQHPEHSTWSTAGDLGRVDEDGYLYLTDRSAFMIISGGINVYPQEIEDALALHPAVLDAAVIGIPDDDLGEVVKAVIQAAPGVVTGPALEAELIAFLRGRLAGYKVPRSLEFVDTLPRTPTGKLAKSRLIEAYRTA
jgi:long-chain acyl-CoA synthetase